MCQEWTQAQGERKNVVYWKKGRIQMKMTANSPEHMRERSASWGRIESVVSSSYRRVENSCALNKTIRPVIASTQLSMHNSTIYILTFRFRKFSTYKYIYSFSRHFKIQTLANYLRYCSHHLLPLYQQAWAGYIFKNKGHKVIWLQKIMTK